MFKKVLVVCMFLLLAANILKASENISYTLLSASVDELPSIKIEEVGHTLPDHSLGCGERYMIYKLNVEGFPKHQRLCLTVKRSSQSHSSSYFVILNENGELINYNQGVDYSIERLQRPFYLVINHPLRGESISCNIDLLPYKNTKAECETTPFPIESFWLDRKITLKVYSTPDQEDLVTLHLRCEGFKQNENVTIKRWYFWPGKMLEDGASPSYNGIIYYNFKPQKKTEEFNIYLTDDNENTYAIRGHLWPQIADWYPTLNDSSIIEPLNESNNEILEE